MHPTRQVLALRPVRVFVASRFLSRFARGLVAAMLSYHVYDVTGSYAALGLLGLVEFLPVIPSALLGGILADRFDRRKLVVFAYLATAVVSALLAAESLVEPASAAFVFMAAFALSIAGQIAAPAASALLPSLVPREIFQNATVFTASATQIAWLTGPITMGFVVEPFGVAAPYGLAAVLYVASSLAMAALELDPSPRTGPGPDRSWRAVGEGMRFVRRTPAVLASMTLDMFAVVFASAVALLPVYAREILEVGPQGYGLLRASMGIGAFSMALVLLIARPFERPGRALLVAVAIFGLATLAFGLSNSFPLSVAAFVLAGMADQVSMTTRSVILQLSTPDELRGRVSAVNMIFIGASNELGDAESGFLASITSATFSVVAGALACLGVTALIGLRVPELARWRASVGAPSRE